MARTQRLFAKFYWQDWLTDPALRLVSFAARGLWMDLLSLMWLSSTQGFLIVNGVSPTTSQIGRLTGGSQRDVESLLRELEDANVFSRNETGTIYSRRMVRDVEYREHQSECGKRGGNPALTPRDSLNSSLKGQDMGDDNGSLNLPLKVLEAEAEAEAISPIVPTGDIQKVEDPSLSRARRLFKMRESTPLDSSQARAWKKNKGAAAATSDEDWVLLEWWFSTELKEAEFRRRDLATLLNNWNAEICRAADVARKHGVRFSEKKEGAAAEFAEAPDGWEAIYALVMGDEPDGISWDRLPAAVQRRIVDASSARGAE